MGMCVCRETYLLYMCSYVFKQREWKYPFHVKIWGLRRNENNFFLPVAAISQAWPHCLCLLLPIWHTQRQARVFCSVSPDSCISFWPRPALLDLYKISSISHFLTLLSTQHRPQWADPSEMMEKWSWVAVVLSCCGPVGGMFPLDGSGQALLTLVPKIPHNAQCSASPRDSPPATPFGDISVCLKISDS